MPKNPELLRVRTHILIDKKIAAQISEMEISYNYVLKKGLEYIQMKNESNQEAVMEYVKRKERTISNNSMMINRLEEKTKELNNTIISLMLEMKQIKTKLERD